MWLIEALKSAHSVTLVTTGGWDLEDLNLTYNTQVQPQDVELRLAPFPRLLQRYSASALRYAYYQRFCRSVADQFDLCISAYNLTDWGRPAIHFIADLAWLKEITGEATGRSPGVIYRDTPIRRAYLAWSRRLLCPSGRDPIHEDLLLPTSEWGAEVLKRRLGASRVTALHPFLHSPARNSLDREKLCEREFAFLSIGRIATEKRIEDTIEILKEVRGRGYPVRLHLAGEFAGDVYGQRIHELCAHNSQWISLEGRVSGTRKQQLFESVAFGISTCRQELFGNSVAEMMCGGILPFVHASGGPAEMLGQSALVYKDNQEAADKIVRVLTDRSLRSALRAAVLAGSSGFSLGATIETVRQIVASELEQPVLALP
jgi:glycosyltransferase involved in cell wall biosynthesis